MDEDDEDDEDDDDDDDGVGDEDGQEENDHENTHESLKTNESDSMLTMRLITLLTWLEWVGIWTSMGNASQAREHSTVPLMPPSPQNIRLLAETTPSKHC